MQCTTIAFTIIQSPTIAIEILDRQSSCSHLRARRNHGEQAVDAPEERELTIAGQTQEVLEKASRAKET